MHRKPNLRFVYQKYIVLATRDHRFLPRAKRTTWLTRVLPHKSHQLRWKYDFFTLILTSSEVRPNWRHSKQWSLWGSIWASTVSFDAVSLLSGLGFRLLSCWISFWWFTLMIYPVLRTRMFGVVPSKIFRSSGFIATPSKMMFPFTERLLKILGTTVFLSDIWVSGKRLLDCAGPGRIAADNNYGYVLKLITFAFIPECCTGGCGIYLKETCNAIRKSTSQCHTFKRALRNMVGQDGFDN